MIPRMSFFPDCSTVIRGASRFVAGAPRCSQACCGGSQACHRHSQTCCRPSHVCRWRSQIGHRRSQDLPGSPKVLSSAPRCSQTYHNYFYGTPVQVIRDPSDSEGGPEWPLMAWYSPEIGASKFTLHILSDTLGGFQWSKYILLMVQHRGL